MAGGLRSNYLRTIRQDSPWLYWRFPTLNPAHYETIPDLTIGGSRSGVWWNPGAVAGLCAPSILGETAVTDNPPDYCYNPTVGAAAGALPYSGPWSSDLPIKVGVNRTYEWWAKRTSGYAANGMMFWSQASTPITASNGAYVYWAVNTRNIVFAPNGSASAGVTWIDAVPLGPNNNGSDVLVHYVLRFDDVASTAELFINNVSKGVKTGLATAQTYVSNGGLRIGEWAAASVYGQYPWLGKFDEFAIYTGALSTERITAHYLAGIQDPAKRAMFF